MSRDVMWIRGEDWQAVYIEGELIDQGHSIDWMQVISELGCNTYKAEADEDWLQDRGDFPDDLNEVVY